MADSIPAARSRRASGGTWARIRAAVARSRASWSAASRSRGIVSAGLQITGGHNTDVDGRSIERVYAELTDGYRHFLRADELVYRAADLCPELAPTRAEVAAEAARPLKEKRQVERAQGLLLSRVLAHPRAGAHLVHAMLRPTSEARER